MNSVLNAGVSTVQSAFALANQSAQSIASVATEPTTDSSANNANSALTSDYSSSDSATITEAAVGLTVAELQSAAGVKVIKTADEMLGTLIDTEV